ncbi:hypothetical protein EPN44_12645 [bacterium]|nr:MAG: hypothetical protein EPN44_12645 [bacterium]
MIAMVDGRERQFPADEVLLAIGREPNAAALNVASAGIAMTAAGWIDVDPTMRTSADGVFAIGDAIGNTSGSQFYTHVAVTEGGIAARNASSGGSERFDPTVIPGAVFTEPEVARVGLTEESHRQRQTSRDPRPVVPGRAVRGGSGATGAARGEECERPSQGPALRESRARPTRWEIRLLRHRGRHGRGVLAADALDGGTSFRRDRSCRQVLFQPA